MWTSNAAMLSICQDRNWAQFWDLRGLLSLRLQIQRFSSSPFSKQISKNIHRLCRCSTPKCSHICHGKWQSCNAEKSWQQHTERTFEKLSLLTVSFMATQQSELKPAQINRNYSINNSTSFQTRVTEHTNLEFKALCWKTDPQRMLLSALCQQSNQLQQNTEPNSTKKSKACPHVQPFTTV